MENTEKGGKVRSGREGGLWELPTSASNPEGWKHGRLLQVATAPLASRGLGVPKYHSLGSTRLWNQKDLSSDVTSAEF